MRRPLEEEVGAALDTVANATNALENLLAKMTTKAHRQAWREAIALLASSQASGHVICTGLGKSGLVAQKVAATMASTGTRAVFVHAGDAAHGDLGVIGPHDTVLAFSWSGSSPELAPLCHFVAYNALPMVAITGGRTSLLAESASVVLELPYAAEAGHPIPAPTTSTTLQVVAGDALAMALMHRRRVSAADFKAVHPGGAIGAAS